MTDAELIARLRSMHWCVYGRERGGVSDRKVAPEAADRIQALTAKLATCEKYRDAYDEMGRIGTQAVRDLEAKLAENEVRLRKAVEGLEDIVKDCEADYPPSHGAIKHFAIATLAEISSHNKGESRDVPDR